MNPASIAVVGVSQRMTRATRVVANLQRDWLVEFA
jgi:hypothetical protein